VALPRLRTRLGLGLAAVGLATTALGVAASPAQAWGESCLDHAPQGANWTELWVSLFDSNPGSWAASSRTFTDGTLSVTISDLRPTTPGGEINPYTIRSFDWSSNIGIDALTVNVWPPGADPILFTYSPTQKGQSGNDVGAPSASNPSKYLSFCYDVGAAPSTTVTSPTTSPTTSVGATSIVRASSTVAPVTTVKAPTTSAAVLPTAVVATPTVPVQVEGITETRPTELARTGRSTTPVALGGAAMVLVGIALICTERRRLPELIPVETGDEITRP
jgi:hypothetical protein